MISPYLNSFLYQRKDKCVKNLGLKSVNITTNKISQSSSPVDPIYHKYCNFNPFECMSHPKIEEQLDAYYLLN